MNNFVESGKASLIIDGQFGDAGKGLVASWIATYNRVDICGASLSTNIDHTFYMDNVKYVTRLFPVSGIMSNRSTIYFSADSVIDTDIFFEEIEKFSIDESRIYIHPRAAVINSFDNEEFLSNISSIKSGTGSARANKILRNIDSIASNNSLLKPFCKKIDLHWMLDQGCSMLIESGQGVGLGLNHGYSYPYCTSRDVLPANLLADFGLHPNYLGNTMLLFRTFPIRVAGTSGPAYSEEISWDDISLTPETSLHDPTTPKRIFRFSKEQFDEVCELVRPTHYFLNFINHLQETGFELFYDIFKEKSNVFVGYGPMPENVSEFYPGILENCLHFVN